MEKGDKGSTLTRMGVSGWMFLLVPAYLGCPGQTAVKWLLLLLQKSLLIRKNGRMTEILGINMGVMVQEMWSPTVHKKNHRSRNEIEHCENFTQNRRTFKGCINTQIHKRHVFSVLETRNTLLNNKSMHIHILRSLVYCIDLLLTQSLNSKPNIINAKHNPYRKSHNITDTIHNNATIKVSLFNKKGAICTNINPAMLVNWCIFETRWFLLHNRNKKRFSTRDKSTLKTRKDAGTSHSQNDLYIEKHQHISTITTSTKLLLVCQQRY